MENNYFYAMVGIADAFLEVSFLEFLRCLNCGAIRLARGLSGSASTPGSFIRAFVKVANDHIAEYLSGQAKNAGFYATLSQNAILDSGASKWFRRIQQSNDPNYYTRTNINGRYLQNLERLCGQDNLFQTDEFDTSRYIHVHQAKEDLV